MTSFRKLLERIQKGENSIYDFTEKEIEILENNGIFPTKGSFNIVFRKKNKKEEKANNYLYIISSIIGNTDVNLKMLASMENFAKKNNAEIILLGMKACKGSDVWYPSSVQKYIRYNVRLHPLLRVIDLDLLPTQINPLIGLQEFSLNDNNHRESCIIASPKQDLETLPYRLNFIPHILFSTGTISIPLYPDNRIGRIAEKNHVFGGLIVEIPSNKLYFNVVNFQFREDGSFIDRGLRYYPDGRVEKEEALTLVVGDLHSEHIDEIALKETIDQIMTYKPKEIFLHDIASWSSVNPHMQGSVLERHIYYTKNITLKEEIKIVTNILKRFVDLPTKVNVVASNHDNFINKYLLSGQYAQDPVNLLECAKCIIAMSEGKSPYKVLFDFGDKINFLREIDDYIIKGVQHAAHGHCGVAGSKGSVIQFSKTFVKSSTGHTHSPKIRHGAYSAGTISKIESGSHGYNKGITNWMQSNIIMWEDGTRQMLFLWESYLDKVNK